MITSRKLLISLTFLALAFSIASFVTYTIEAQHEWAAYVQEENEARANGEMTFSGRYCTPDRHSTFLLAVVGLVGTSFILVCTLRNPIWSMPFSAAAFSIYPLLYWGTQYAIELAENAQVNGLDKYIYGANVFDVLVFSILLVSHFTFLVQAIAHLVKRAPQLP